MQLVKAFDKLVKLLRALAFDIIPVQIYDYEP